jgi:prepilin-type N-terminal cleavage/methylation domain-containing protein
MKLLKNQKGLTLIELLVVIVILGIIAAIAIPAIMGQSEKANKSAAEQTNAVVKDAAQRYAAVEGVSTVTMGDLMTVDKEYFQDAPECPGDYVKLENTVDLLGGSTFCTAPTGK